MRVYHILILLTVCLFPALGQKTDSLLHVQMDFANRWVWRGVSYSEVPVMFPAFGYKSEKINATILGAYPFERRAYSEINFIFEYQLHPAVKLGFTDYFAINDSLGAKHRFFDMKRETTMHMFDFYFNLTPFKSTPVSLTYSIWVWGADRDEVTLEQRFSQYIEARYDKAVGSYTASAFAGFTPAKGFYAPRAAFVNLGIGLMRSYKIGEQLSMPLKFEFVLNPELQNTYLNAVLTIK